MLLRPRAPDGARSASGAQPGAIPPYGFTPLVDALPREHHEGLLWGTYRPGIYAGIKSRTYPHALAAGAMWTGGAADSAFLLRHECEQEDDTAYGYTTHDGRSVGLQRIADPRAGLELETTFVRVRGQEAATAVLASGGASAAAAGEVDEWALHVRASALEGAAPPGELTSVLLYVAIDSEGALLPDGQGLRLVPPTAPARGRAEGEDTAAAGGSVSAARAGTTRALGSLDGIGPFELAVGAAPTAGGDEPDADQALEVRVWSSAEHIPLSALRSTVSQRLDPTTATLQGTEPAAWPVGRVRLLVVQVRAQLPFVAQISLARTSLAPAEPAAPRPPAPVLEAPGAVARAARLFAGRFEQAFDKAFGLSERTLRGRPLSARQVALARQVVSLQLGSHAFLYGPSVLKSRAGGEGAGEGAGGGAGRAVETAAAPLFTAVPSRSFFPRGFLWDEGFHQLVVSRFDPALSADVLLHWCALVQRDGWVAREQILGAEARARVPEHFIAQERDVANPPTLLLLVEALVRVRATASAAHRSLLDAALSAALPSLEAWFGWLLTSQAAAS
jgi:mannosyl-oligosaccharide glucosidase